MQKKILKYSLIAVLLFFVGYHAVYFKKLSEVKQTAGNAFDAIAYTDQLWKNELPAQLNNAVELSELMTMIQQDPDKAFAKYSNAMAIGNYRYSLVTLTAIVQSVNEDDIAVEIPTKTGHLKSTIATEFIYGNAIRDASALVDIRHFPNSADLSGISEALNDKVRKEIIPSFKARVKTGNRLNVIAAIEINKEHIQTNDFELVPLQLTIIQ